MNKFDIVLDRVQDAKAIAWDTCHKIYILMDDEQVAKMREYEYDPLYTTKDMTPDVMFNTVQDWYDTSCGLRFIQAVTTNHEDPNAGYESIIEQFFDEKEEDQ
jgi:hypothetical protein